jgi:two-component system, chemotaxis family, protein-glutamate methylesterase/glutaminase
MATENNTLNVVAVGASAGGVEALTQLAGGLSPDLSYAVLVVLRAGPSAVRAYVRHGEPGG